MSVELPLLIVRIIVYSYVAGAMRLARFNCLASMPKKPGTGSDFRGIPIPMAAGFIAYPYQVPPPLIQGQIPIGFPFGIGPQGSGDLFLQVSIVIVSGDVFPVSLPPPAPFYPKYFGG